MRAPFAFKFPLFLSLKNEGFVFVSEKRRQFLGNIFLSPKKETIFGRHFLFPKNREKSLKKGNFIFIWNSLFKNQNVSEETKYRMFLRHYVYNPPSHMLEDGTSWTFVVPRTIIEISKNRIAHYGISDFAISCDFCSQSLS